MITYQYRAKNNESLEALNAARAGVWIDVENMSAEDVEVLSGRHSLDEGLLGDAQDFFEAPRFEVEGGVAYIYTRFPSVVEGEKSTAPILIAVGEDFVLTTVHQKPEFLKKLQSSKVIFTTQKTKLFLQILDAIAKEYAKGITAIRRDVRRHRMHVRAVSEKTIEESVHFEYALNEYVSALVPTNLALARALGANSFPLFEEDEDLLEDVQLANNQLIETAKSTLKTIQNTRAAHSTLVSNRLNKTVKTLTALTILLTIPTIVGTLYGMNVPLPGSQSPTAFWAIVLLVLGIAGIVTFFFHRNRWI